MKHITNDKSLQILTPYQYSKYFIFLINGNKVANFATEIVLVKIEYTSFH